MSAGEASKQRVDRMMKQARKYSEDWGRGAFVFQHGYCTNLEIALRDVAMVLDGSFLIEDDDIPNDSSSSVATDEDED